MKDRTFTMTPVLIGIAGAIVVACSPAPAGAEPPPAHPCDSLVPALHLLHKNAVAGLPAPLLEHLTLTDETLGGIGRGFVLSLVQFIRDNPATRRTSTPAFTAAALDACKAQYSTDHLITPVERRRSLEHGDI